MTATTATAPKHLKAATKRWYAAVCEEYILAGHHLRLLQLAGEAWDRGQQAREALALAGSLTFTDDRGNPRPRPEIKVEEAARIAFARLLRELDLDIEPPKATRLPGRY